MLKRINLFAAALALGAVSTSHAAAPDKRDVVATYADIAHATYADSLATAQSLLGAIEAFLADPTEPALAAARSAWRAARVPYQQSEVYRFGNAIVDDWEGRVNAWPLDEGLIDYVEPGYYGTASDENKLFVANVIANPSLTFGGTVVDAGRIDARLLQETLHEADGVEANVATGYHAIEFLLWGQDLNGTGSGAGARPATDYRLDACTNGNCDRRAAYLRTATALLVDDLGEMVAAWAPGGAARQGLLDGDPDAGIGAIVTGMGSLSFGELAGERMQLGLLLHDPEEEHDCFSDNTHSSHFYDALGIRNVYLGHYERVDGSVVAGPSLSALTAGADQAADAALRDALDATLAAMTVIVDRAEGGEAYDQMIGEGNESGNRAVQAAIDRLRDQTRAISGAVAALKLSPIEFEDSDSLSNSEAVFQ